MLAESGGDLKAAAAEDDDKMDEDADGEDAAGDTEMADEKAAA